MLPRLAAAYLCEARSPYTSVSTVHHHRADAEAQVRIQLSTPEHRPSRDLQKWESVPVLTQLSFRKHGYFHKI